MNPFDTRAALVAHQRQPAGQVWLGCMLPDPDEDTTEDDRLAAERARDARRRAGLKARQIERGSRKC